jgi:hypothetical protein
MSEDDCSDHGSRSKQIVEHRVESRTFTEFMALDIFTCARTLVLYQLNAAILRSPLFRFIRGNGACVSDT